MNSPLEDQKLDRAPHKPVNDQLATTFQLSETSTLEAVSNADESIVAQDIQARVDEAEAQAKAMPEVAQAIANQHGAAEQLTKLRLAERALNQQAKETRQQSDLLSSATLDDLIQSAASGDANQKNSSSKWKKLSEVSALETQLRFTGKALERLSEHLIPLAEIASIREEAHALMAESRAIERIAQQRAEKLLNQMREVVSEEMVLPVDLSKGVSGSMLARAAALKARAIQLSVNADRLEQLYQARA